MLSRPKPIATLLPTLFQRSLPPEFPPTPSAPLYCQDCFNASTLPTCSSFSYSKTTLSVTAAKGSSTDRRGLQFDELPPSTLSGLFADEAHFFHTNSVSSPNSTLESVVARASRYLQDRLLREPPPSSKRVLRGTTVAQHKAEPLCKARLLLNFTAFSSSRNTKILNRTKHL